MASPLPRILMHSGSQVEPATGHSITRARQSAAPGQRRGAEAAGVQRQRSGCRRRTPSACACAPPPPALQAQSSRPSPAVPGLPMHARATVYDSAPQSPLYAHLTSCRRGRRGTGGRGRPGQGARPSAGAAAAASPRAPRAACLPHAGDRPFTAHTHTRGTAQGSRVSRGEKAAGATHRVDDGVHVEEPAGGQRLWVVHQAQQLKGRLVGGAVHAVCSGGAG